MGDWKALRLALGKPVELYNLKTDAGEKEDVSRQHPEIAARLESYLQKARADSALWPLRSAEEERRERKHPAPEPD